MKMKTRMTILLAFIPVWLCAAGAGHADQPFLSYSHSAGLSPYGKVEATIQSSGQANVLIKKHSGTPISYQTTLSQYEMAALDTIIMSSGFFSLDLGQTVSPADFGQTEITISKGSNLKTLSFGLEPTLQPLGNYLWRLCAQAIAITSIESDTDVYTATGAVNSNLVGAKALQPDRLQEPLIAYVKRSKDTQRIGWALEALGCIMTPEEMLGLLAEELKKSDRQELIFRSMPGGLPKPHLEALCPLYLSFVRESLARRSELTRIEQNAFDGFLVTLGDRRYEPAIPIFKTLFDHSTQPSLHPDVIPLARMGAAGLSAIIPYLDSTNEIHRSYAIELFQIAARGNPKSKYSNPYSTWEYEQMIPWFKERIIVRLKEMQEKDPSIRVQTMAKEAIAEIASEIAK
jgi:hypothetical protein